MTKTVMAVLMLSAAVSAQEPKIVSKDPRFDKLVPPTAKFEKLGDGYKWVEGPVWNRKEGYLLFSDIPNNAIMQWKPGGGAPVVFLQPSGYTGSVPFTGREPGSNGLTYDKQGNLVLCDHGDRRIARVGADKKKTTVADKYDGKRLNSPNDLVYKSNGDLYFTDPPYGLPKTFDDPGKEVGFNGVYRVSKDGTVTALVKDLKAPNGIAFSPDEKTLYVANSDSTHAVVMKYDVQKDGTLANGKVFADMTSEVKGHPGVPDGMKVDKAGNLFSTGPGGIHVYSPDGTLLGVIEFSVATANLNWGDDGATLYIASNTAIYRLKVSTRGY